MQAFICTFSLNDHHNAFYFARNSPNSLCNLQSNLIESRGPHIVLYLSKSWAEFLNAWPYCTTLFSANGLGYSCTYEAHLHHNQNHDFGKLWTCQTTLKEPKGKIVTKTVQFRLQFLKLMEFPKNIMWTGAICILKLSFCCCRFVFVFRYFEYLHVLLQVRKKIGIHSFF